MLNRGISLTMWDIFNYVLERGIDKVIYALNAKILQEPWYKIINLMEPDLN